VEIGGLGEARKAARQLVKEGDGCLKLAANGLGMGEPELTEPEMRGVLEAAHNAGIKVAALSPTSTGGS
jgi:hypothetical protein